MTTSQKQVSVRSARVPRLILFSINIIRLCDSRGLRRRSSCEMRLYAHDLSFGMLAQCVYFSWYGFLLDQQPRLCRKAEASTIHILSIGYVPPLWTRIKDMHRKYGLFFNPREYHPTHTHNTYTHTSPHKDAYHVN